MHVSYVMSVIIPCVLFVSCTVLFCIIGGRRPLAALVENNKTRSSVVAEENARYRALFHDLLRLPILYHCV